MLSRENRAVLCCTVLGDGGGAAEQSNNSSGTPRPVPFHHHPPLPPPPTHAPASPSPFQTCFSFKALVMFLWVPRVAVKEEKEAQEALCLGCRMKAPEEWPPRLAVVWPVALPPFPPLPPSILPAACLPHISGPRSAQVLGIYP